MKPEDAITVYRPVLQAVEDHPKEVVDFAQALIMEEDRLEGDTPFWEIWQAFADQLVKVKWLGDLDKRHSMASDSARLLSTLLFGIPWKDDTRYWPRLKGQEYRVEGVVQSIPPSTAALKAYCRFLYHIGERSLPDGFKVVAERLGEGNASEALTDSTVVHYLESLLRRYVYGEPLQLKVNPHIRSAVLYILDILVDAGSSAAYKIRDDFVTPMSSRAAGQVST